MPEATFLPSTSGRRPFRSDSQCWEWIDYGIWAKKPPIPPFGTQIPMSGEPGDHLHRGRPGSEWTDVEFATYTARFVNQLAGPAMPAGGARLSGSPSRAITHVPRCWSQHRVAADARSVNPSAVVHQPYSSRKVEVEETWSS